MNIQLVLIATLIVILAGQSAMETSAIIETCKSAKEK